MSPSPKAPEPHAHLLLPFAGVAEPAAMQALRGTPLPTLSALLARLQSTAEHGTDEFSLSPPHEHALAWARGLPAVDGQLPWAALDSAEPGLPQAWFHPAHFQVGMDHVSLVPAEHLGLDDTHARPLFDALAPLCAEDGVGLRYLGPTRWLASGERLRGLACASLDRVAGRSIAPWQPQGEGAAWLKRLQSEAQMLFYTHPVNDAREAARQAIVNGFWASGAGAHAGAALAPSPVVDDRLREAALRADWAAWRQAWATLDAEVLPAWRERLARGEPMAITLCGERLARTFTPSNAGWLARLGQRLRPAPTAHSVLDAL